MNPSIHMEAGDGIRSAGKVVNFSNKGNIILRAREAPRLGSQIVDKRSNSIGKLIRITGPVSSPYLIVSPGKTEGETIRTLLGKELYISERPPRDRGPARRREPSRGKERDHRRSSGFRDHDQKGGFKTYPKAKTRSKNRSGHDRGGRKPQRKRK